MIIFNIKLWAPQLYILVIKLFKEKWHTEGFLILCRQMWRIQVLLLNTQEKTKMDGIGAQQTPCPRHCLAIPPAEGIHFLRFLRFTHEPWSRCHWDWIKSFYPVIVISWRLQYQNSENIIQNRWNSRHFI